MINASLPRPPASVDINRALTMAMEGRDLAANLKDRPRRGLKSKDFP